MIILFLIISNQKISDLTKVVNVFIYMGIISSIWAFIEIFFNIGSTGSKWYGVISRADSFFSEPNEFSQYLVMPFAYIISKIFTSTYYNSKTTNINYIIFFLIILAAQILSFSRGGILAFMTQLLFAFFLTSNDLGIFKLIKKTWNYLIIILAIVIFTLNFELVPNFKVIDALDLIIFRFFNTLSADDASLYDRFLTYRLGLNNTFHSFNTFFFGNGRGSLVYTMGQLNPRFIGVATTSNYLIDILSETGFLGLLSFIYLIKKTFIKSFFLFISKPFIYSEKYCVLFLGSILSMVGLLVGGLTSATHLHVFFWFQLGILCSIVINYEKIMEKS